MSGANIQDIQRLFFHDSNGEVIMLGTAYLDESADPDCQVAFVAAGFYCPDSEWKRLRSAWRKVLRPHKINYYRTYDWRTLQNGFEVLKEKWGNGRARIVADEIRVQLERVLTITPVIAGFGIGINMRDFREVDAMPEAQANRQWMREVHEYDVAAFRNVFHHITETMCHRVDENGLVAFVCDDSSRYPKIKRGYDRIKIKFPELGAKMLSLAALDDQHVPELQMADLMADIARRMVQEHIMNNGAEVLPPTLPGQILSVQCWNKKGMLAVLNGERLGC